MLRIIVCIKQVLDPEAPISAYEIDDSGRRVKVRGAPPALSPFDENALEAALRIKDIHTSKITVISMGTALAKPVLKKSLAAGADELFLLEDSKFAELDSYDTAYILAAAIIKIGAYDIIFTGRQAADSNAGIVGLGMAEILGIPSVTLARSVELLDKKLRIERMAADSREIVEIPLPALITVSNELGELRSVNIKDIMAAQKKSYTVLRAEEMGIHSYLDKRTRLVKLFIPNNKTKCEIIGGETPEEAGQNLAIRLGEAKLIYHSFP